MRNTLIILAELHYEFGLIGYDEFKERIQVALWLNDEMENLFFKQAIKKAKIGILDVAYKPGVAAARGGSGDRP